MELNESGSKARIPYKVRVVTYSSLDDMSTYITMEITSHTLDEVEQAVAEVVAVVNRLENAARRAADYYRNS